MIVAAALALLLTSAICYSNGASATEPPDQPHNLKVLDKSGRSVKLSWSSPFDGNSPITRYLVEYKRNNGNWDQDSDMVPVPGSSNLVAVFDLRPATTYNMRIVARNAIGDSDPSDTVTIVTAGEAPSGPPRDLKAKAVDRKSLNVTWKPPVKDEWNGDIMGYYIGYRLANSRKPYQYETVEFSREMGNDHHFIISYLKTYMEYSVRVNAFNKIGLGPISEVRSYTAEGTPFLPPQNVECEALHTNATIKVSWLPIPLEKVQGVLKGYKVIYDPSDAWYKGGTRVIHSLDEEERYTKITNSTEIYIQGLSPYTIYNFQVLAYTAAGEGVRSRAIQCQTDQDLPSSPTDVKAFIKSANSILVSWRKPEHPNGIITQYTVYYKKQGETDSKAEQHKLPPSQFNFEATELKQRNNYVFWVTASTTVGEGERSQSVHQKPSDIVPAKIVSYGEEYLITSREDIKLQCETVGIPNPDFHWTKNGEPLNISSNYRLRVLPDFLLIREVSDDDAGKYTCYAENSYGTDTVTHTLLVQGPPPPPEIQILFTTTKSIGLNLTPSVLPDHIEIHGYKIYFKPVFSGWETVNLSRTTRNYTLDGLWCGTPYSIYAAAYNKIGTGDASEIVNTPTKGNKPIVPELDNFVEVSAASITLHLDAWDDGGCKMNFFVIEYKSRYQVDWIMVSNRVSPSGNYVIMELTPATWYRLRITAHNNAGSSVAEYDCATFTATGARLHPPEIKTLSTTSNSIEVNLKPSVLHDDTTPKHDYTIYYKSEFSDWESIQVPVSTRTYTLENLWCGSQYRIYTSAYNNFVTVESFDVLTHTKGNKPDVPEVHNVVEVSSTSVTLHLDAWGDGGCPIKNFVVEYKSRHQDNWTIESTQVKPTGNYVILELTPATWYNLRITANNDAGSSIAEYEFATLTVTGGSIDRPRKIQRLSTTTNSIEVKLEPSVLNDDTVPSIGYTIYYKSEFSDWESIQVPSTIQIYTLEGLRCGSQYQIYASAYNMIGNSYSSEIVNTHTKGKKPEVPDIDRFLQVLSRSITLRLDAWSDGGCPIQNFVVEYKTRSQVDWTLNSARVRAGGNYLIMDLTPATLYNLRITANNSAGSSVAEYECATPNVPGAPTHPPEIQIQRLSTTTNSIDVKLEQSVLNDDTIPIHGYTIYYKPEFSDWESVQIPDAAPRTFTLVGLWCGTQYQIQASAYNGIGTSYFSEILNTHTKGKKPEVPEGHRFLEASSRSITLHLKTWGDGGCPMNYFVIEYKSRDQVDWIMASNQVRPTGNYVIMDLTPATRYNLRITAHNNAGFSVAEYTFATLSVSGDGS